MDAIKVSITDPAIRKIVKACYPDYKGRKVKVEGKSTYHMSNYWDGGSRSYAIAYHLESGATMEPTQVSTNPMNRTAHASVEIPEGVVIVEHSIFMGKDVGIRIYANPVNVARFIPGSPVRNMALSSSTVSGLNQGLNALLKGETAIDKSAALDALTRRVKDYMHGRHAGQHEAQARALKAAWKDAAKVALASGASQFEIGQAEETGYNQ
jgi:hypothetical protein